MVQAFSIEAVDFDDEIERFNVDIDGESVPLLLKRKAGAHTLTVFANGAIDFRSGKDPHEVFQRSTWSPLVDSHCLYFSDVTTSRETKVNLGWGQGTAERYFLPRVADAVSAVSRAIGISDSRKRIYYGSSGGGFQSLVLAALDRGSSALVNNPQTNWLDYNFAGAVKRVLDYSFNGLSRVEVLARYPTRASIPHLYLDIGYVPNIRYLVNAASKNDLETDLAHLLGGLQGFLSNLRENNLDVNYYWDPEAGHSPLSQERTVQEINQLISRLEK